jgi:hypothetical protein
MTDNIYNTLKKLRQTLNNNMIKISNNIKIYRQRHNDVFLRI